MSNVVCILSGTEINEGDRIVAVLATPRIRPSAMFQEYAPVDPYHSASAASFPIRGLYGAYGSFEPDPDQASADLLRRAVGDGTWDDVVRKLHEEGISVSIRDFPRPYRSEQRPAAFAFVHEDVYEAVLGVVDIRVDPGPAVERVMELADEMLDPEKKSRAAYRLISFYETGHPFGTDQAVSSAFHDRIGAEILARTIERFTDKVLDAGTGRSKALEDEAKIVFGCLADVTVFENVLKAACVALQPSMTRSVHPQVRAAIATASLRRIVGALIERDVENGEPTPLVDDVAEMAGDLSRTRREADDRMAEELEELKEEDRTYGV